MILRRLTGNLKAQNWTTVAIEFLIVVIGVFIGTQVSNWNQERLEKAETRRMIDQLGPSLTQLSDYFRSARQYYAVTRSYSNRAIAGWRNDPEVSDKDFVIAAYQASQIYTLGNNSSTWSAIVGADQLRNIEDKQLRTDLAFLMSADYAQIDQPAVDTPYRHNVRRIIPVEVQDLIRDKCGDRPLSNSQVVNLVYLPARCDIELTPAAATKAGTLLRAHPELLEDLQWHVAATAAFLTNIVPFETAVHRVEQKIRAAPRRDRAAEAGR